MTPEQIEIEKTKIDEMSHCQMAFLWRHAQSGHPYFDQREPISEYFLDKFRSLGGMTPHISKAVGW